MQHHIWKCNITFLIEALCDLKIVLSKEMQLKYYFRPIYSDLLSKVHFQWTLEWTFHFPMDFEKYVRISSSKIFQFYYFPQKCTCF